MVNSVKGGREGGKKQDILCDAIEITINIKKSRFSGMVSRVGRLLRIR